jgi:hypothetical protein
MRDDDPLGLGFGAHDEDENARLDAACATHAAPRPMRPLNPVGFNSNILQAIATPIRKQDPECACSTASLKLSPFWYR